MGVHSFEKASVTSQRCKLGPSFPSLNPGLLMSMSGATVCWLSLHACVMLCYALCRLHGTPVLTF